MALYFQFPVLFALVGTSLCGRANHQAQISLKDVEDVGQDGEGNVDDPAREAYMDLKLSIEHEVVKDYVNRPVPMPNADPTGTKTVAFIFFTMTDIQFPELWERFFENAPRSQYSIYVHRAKKEATGALPLQRFGAISIPWVQTAWCALFGVEVAGLSRALQDTSNTQFVFVSDSSVPLKKFSFVYRELIEKSPTTSKFCLAEEAKHSTLTAEVAMSWTSGCLFKDFYRAQNPRVLKHHQWAVLSRNHAVSVVRQSSKALDVYAAAWRKAAPDINGMGEGCSDESVPITALLLDIEANNASLGNTLADLTRMGVEQQCLTFVRWRNCFKGTELDLSNTLLSEMKTFWSNKAELVGLLTKQTVDPATSQLKRDLNGFPHVFDTTLDLDYLKRLVREGFMFARKFTPGIQVVNSSSDTRLPLTEVLPKLWDEVDEEASRKSFWSHLDTGGRLTASSRSCN